jgi:pilus assembly protein Flp/PilA
MLAYLRKVTRCAEDRGASAVEYGLMVAAVAAVIVFAVFTLGTNIQKAFKETNNTICTTPGPGGIADCTTIP